MKEKIIIILSLLVLGLAGYLIYDNANKGMTKAEVQSELNDLKSEYEFIQKDMEVNLNSLNISNKLIFAQKKKIENILKKNEISRSIRKIYIDVFVAVAWNRLNPVFYNIGDDSC